MDVVWYDKVFRIEGQGFCVEFRDTPSNRKVAVIFLRGMRDGQGRRLFTLQELASIVGSSNRQAASEHVEGFRACGEDFGATLQRKRKVDGQVVEAVRRELYRDPLVSVGVLRDRVCSSLGREDLSEANIQAALDQLSCGEIRRVMGRQLDRGEAHYKETYLLEEMTQSLSSEAGARAGFGGGLSEAPLVSDPTAIRKLIEPGGSLDGLPGGLLWVCRCLTFYYWGIPLSRLGLWLGVHKTTVLRWMMGLVQCLWPVVYQWITTKIRGGVVLVDEKWIKLRGVWHYWFVALDETTQLPLVDYLSAHCSLWACRWVGVQLKGLGIRIKAVCTDGLAGYAKMLPGVVHLRCHFHHQQGVTRWLQAHIPKGEDVRKRKQAMKKVLKTSDKRTVRRRLEKLSLKASAWGIMGWVEQTRVCLAHLLPSVGSRVLPRTTNAIERFFRTFTRFYKVRCGFHSLRSARWELMLFMLVYVFTQRDQDGKAPIESIMPQAAQMPLYRLLNDPFDLHENSQDVKQTPSMADESTESLLAA